MAISLHRAKTAEDIETWTKAVARTFHFTGPLDDLIALGQRFHASGDRSTLAKIDGAIAGTFRSYDTPLTMPGGDFVDVDAITGITVQSTHRRRGVLTKMMRADLGAAVDRGQAAAILWSAEYPIYGRYGFGSATRANIYTLDRARAALRSPRTPTPDSGSIRFVSTEELRRLAPPVFERIRRARAGEITRNKLKWELESNTLAWPGREWKGWQVLSTDSSGTLDGYAQYHVDDHWEHDSPKSTLWVDVVVATTPAAHRRLWSYLIGIDLIATIKANEVRIDDPLRKMLHDGRGLVVEQMSDGLWLRPLDPVALLSARSLGTGSVTVEIVDPLGIASAVVQIEAGNVKRLRRSTADITLDVGTFGSLILGDGSAHELTAAGLIDEHKRGAVARLHTLLHTAVPPHCTTHF